MMIPLRTAYRRRLAIGALIVAAAAVLTGCSNSGTDAGSTGDTGTDGVKPIKIALSNYFNGNIWRKQMEASFEATAKANPDYVSDFKVVNSDGSAPQQAQQIQSLVLEGYDAIIIDAASPTALNGAIQEACDAGVTVVVFDSLATADCAYKVAFDYETYGEVEAQFTGRPARRQGQRAVRPRHRGHHRGRRHLPRGNLGAVEVPRHEDRRRGLWRVHRVHRAAGGRQDPPLAPPGRRRAHRGQ